MSGFKHGGYEKDINKGTASKFRHGGFEDEDKPVKVSSPQHYQDDEEEESWPSYIGRNIAKVPTLAYEMGRSGLGLGNLLDMVLPGQQGTTPISQDPNQALYDYLANYKSGATTGLRTALPSTQQANKEISAILPEYMTQHKQEDWPAEYALTELPLIALTGGFKSLPAFGRSALQSLGILGGSQLGEEVGGTIGEQIGFPNLGRIGGAVAGGHLGGMAARAITPGKTNIVPTKAIAPEKIIEDLREQQRPNYEAAVILEGNKSGNASKFINILNDVNEDIGLGMSKSDQSYVRELIKDLDNAVSSGEMTLAQAKTAKRNINDQLYEHTVSNPVKKQLTKLVGGLNEFIMENGSPEHNKFWQQAEQNTRDIKKFENQIRRVKENKESLPAIIKEGMTKFKMPVALSSLAKWLGFGNSVSAITGLLTEGARRLFLEGKYLYKISKEHPDIYKKYINTLSEAYKIDANKVAFRINDMAKKLDEDYREE